MKRGAASALLVCSALLSFARPAPAWSCRSESSAPPAYVPAYAKLQTGGYLGALTLGIGYTPWEVLDFGAYYGWVPARLGGVDIHSLALRGGARVEGVCLAEGWEWVYLTGGIGALFTRGDGFFLSVPERYHDDRYYRRTGVRSFLSVGSELNRRGTSGAIVAAQGGFVEITALDEYLRMWAKSPRAEPLISTLSTTVGYRIAFR